MTSHYQILKVLYIIENLFKTHPFRSDSNPLSSVHRIQFAIYDILNVLIHISTDLAHDEKLHICDIFNNVSKSIQAHHRLNPLLFQLLEQQVNTQVMPITPPQTSTSSTAFTTSATTNSRVKQVHRPYFIPRARSQQPNCHPTHTRSPSPQPSTSTSCPPPPTPRKLIATSPIPYTFTNAERTIKRQIQHQITSLSSASAHPDYLRPSTNLTRSFSPIPTVTIHHM